MIANDVLKMLESRHAKDAFFSEVAIDGNKRRMDAWAMIPSYSKTCLHQRYFLISQHRRHFYDQPISQG